MMKISAKRMLLTAAAASSLAAVMVPQAASAAQESCYGRQQCETDYVRNDRDRHIRYHARAQERDGDRARGRYEVKNRGGYTVKSGYFYGSTDGQADVRPRQQYKLKVSSYQRNVYVMGRCSTD